MKTSQLVGAIVALAAMVFVVTFAMNYLGQETPQGPEPGIEEVGSLDFPEKVFPSPPSRPGDPIGVCCELNDSSGHNFWFVNPHDRAVQVGLINKNCTCSSVRFAVVPQAALPRLAAGYTGHVASLGTDPLARLTAFLGFGGALAEQALVQGRPVEMMEAIGTIEVPPRAVGWFRLGWIGRRLEEQSLKAELWIGDPASRVTLQAHVKVVPPMRLLGGIEVRPTHSDELPLDVELFCWSPTRPSFQLEAAVAHPRGGRPESDPLQVSEPVPLSAEERATLERHINAQVFNGPVRSGYRIPVTLRPFSEDGKTPFEIGAFRRQVRLSSPDEGIETELVTVQGKIRGDVQVVGGTEGSLQFGSFPRGRGSNTQTVTLRTEVPGVRVEVDKERTPDYLDVALPEEPVVKGRERIWRVEVRIPPNKARGPFPRSQDPRYRDSALYFKTAGDKPRSIRVPVRGTANEG